MRKGLFVLVGVLLMQICVYCERIEYTYQIGFDC